MTITRCFSTMTQRHAPASTAPTIDRRRRRTRRPLGALAVVLLIGAVTVACGGSSGSDDPSTSSSAAAGAAASSSAGGPLTVLAASSLKDVFPKLAEAFSKEHGGAQVRFSFAGSDELATQIQEGAPADVYAAASPKYPDQLAAAGKLDAPVPFATNTLVLAVPSGSTKVTSLDGLTAPGVKLVIGAEGVPVGDYTRTVLGALDGTAGAGYSAAVMKNVVSEEQNVKGIVAKLASGDADAGFVYTTDVKAAGSDLQAIDIPASAKPSATYPIGVVHGSSNADLAGKWVSFVLSPEGQQLLAAAGFGAAPAP
jgi:molybdate transport system substrate-binding protein